MQGWIGEKNPQWTGDKISRQGVHLWIHDHKKKPHQNRCEVCKKVSKLDAANISGKYLRDINDFMWMCRKCHMLSDGRLGNLIKYKKHEK